MQHTAEHVTHVNSLKYQRVWPLKVRLVKTVLTIRHLILPIGYAHCDAQSAAGCLLVMFHFGHSYTQPLFKFQFSTCNIGHLIVVPEG